MNSIIDILLSLAKDSKKDSTDQTKSEYLRGYCAGAAHAFTFAAELLQDKK